MRREFQRIGRAEADNLVSPMGLMVDYFALFGLPPIYTIDATDLQARFHALQRALHPDRLAQTTETDHGNSVLVAARINDAYATLRDPLERARYLLQLKGIDVAARTDAAVSSTFLHQQIEWREAFDDARGAKDRTAFDSLITRLRDETRKRYDEITTDFETNAGIHAARLVYELQFLERLAGNALESLDAWEDDSCCSK